MDINGKVAIVTGGASGLGEATARLYHSLGASVAIFDLNLERGEALVAELGERSRYFGVNVADEAAVQDAVNGTVAAFGAIHIVNNFAGIGSAKKTVGKDGPHPLDEFTRVIDINLVGTFNVLRLAAAQMCQQDPIDEDGQRGVIINTASIAAYEGQIGQVAYSASKGAIVGMTLPIARDLAKQGVRCNTIVPGLIHTPLFELLPEPAYQALQSQTLFPHRLGKPEEIAGLSRYIVENDYTNGECIRMDSGLRMPPR